MRVAPRAFACLAFIAAIEVSAQTSFAQGENSIPFEDRARPIDVAGAPGSSGTASRRIALRDLAYAAPRLSVAEIHSPGPLTSAERHSLRSALRSEERLQVGISRALSAPVGIDASVSQLLPSPGGNVGGGLLERRLGQMVWTAAFESPGAGAVRLRLEQVSLPAGTLAYVYSRSGEAHGPYELGGTSREVVWTNTVFSSRVYLEIRFPAGFADLSTARFRIGALGHVEHPRFAPSSEAKASAEALPDCFRDVNCANGDAFEGLDDAKRAVALMLFERDKSIYSCTGALVNTTAGNSVPYFLTANHCVNSATSASSLELFWDFQTSACGAPAPNQSGFQRTLGSMLLATGSSENGKADFTLLRLAQDPPAERFYLGYTLEPLATSGGTAIYRVGHPEGGPQMLSKHSISEVPTPGACSSLPQGRFIYSKNEIGATKGGSSGAPAFLADGLKIVGQLYGRCGNNLFDVCDATQNSAVDGALESYFADVAYWLSPSEASTCNPGANVLCLLDARFKVELTARDQRTGATGVGVPIDQNDLFGYFSLPSLTDQPDNPEVFVKVLDGRAVSGKFWVFYGGLTDLEFTLKVTDTFTAITKTYTKPAGSFCGNADTRAF